MLTSSSRATLLQVLLLLVVVLASCPTTTVYGFSKLVVVRVPPRTTLNTISSSTRRRRRKETRVVSIPTTNNNNKKKGNIRLYHSNSNSNDGNNNDDEDIIGGATTKNVDGGLLSNSSIPLPTLSQLLCVWLIAVSGNRLIQALPQVEDMTSSTTLVANIALNGVLFAGGLYTLVKSLVGIDYDNLEDLTSSNTGSKSWAKQAGEYALRGEIPMGYVVDVVEDDDAGGERNTIYCEVATFAGGCFWGTELRYQRQPGVIATSVGYTQGRSLKPNYEQVCSGSTGHTESIQLIYDPTIVSYERLVRILLLDSIGPENLTKLNQVGNDKGTQYRHGIYYHTTEQKSIATSIIQSYQESSSQQQPIVTEIKPATIFWPAENYHQRYLEKGGQSAEKNCDDPVRCYG